MMGLSHLMLKTASDRMRGFVFCGTLCACLAGTIDGAIAQQAVGQEPASTGGPSAPPLDPPGERPLASGDLSIGSWLLSPTLDLYTFYDTNIHSTPIGPLSGPGFHFHPALLADYDTGIYETKLYGNIDSEVYPTLNYTQNTFNRQAGVIQTFAPLRDLTFTVQGDYAHNTNAPAVINSIPTPIVSPANPVPTGAAGIVANQATVVSPNDAFTVTGNVSKQFNRAFLSIGGLISRTEYEINPTQDFDSGSYYASGGIWISPILYAFANASDANTLPAIGSISNSYSARGGIGSSQIGAFLGSAYYGQQGSAEDGGGGISGGDIYGGVLTFVATPLWTMSVSVDRLRNRSDITGGTAQALAGLSLSAVAIPTNSSTQNTTIAYRTNYTLSEQASVYFLLSDARTAYLSMPIVNNSWLASTGLSYTVNTRLSLSAEYQYTRYISPQPLTSYNRNLITLGAHYRF
jgi:opacity protein-like surface antigen